MSGLRPRTSRRRWEAFAAAARALAWALLAAAAAWPAAAQTGAAVPAPPGSPAAEPPRPGLYVGVATCASATCHGATEPRRVFDVLQNEYFTWLQDDAHAQAYNALLGERSRAIARNLHLPEPAEASRRCLDCHALAPPAARRERLLEVEDGVSCESCHGPASGWLEGHRSQGWTHADSVAAGMTDLADAAVRAATCLGCHLGDAGRGVDHELLAAGHPPLVFELDNYTADMPPHWAPPRERRDPERRRAMAASHGAGALAVGQAVAFRDGLARLARRARGEGWPEFAELVCGDCHHSLAEERWRRPRADRAAPGRPRWNGSRWAVLRALVGVAAPDRTADLDRRVAEIAAGVVRPGASGAPLAASAEAAAAAAGGLVPLLRDASWDPPRVRRVLLALAADRDGPATAGVEAAEQTLLAVNTLVSELLADRPEEAGGGLVGTVEAMNRELANPYGYDRGRFAALLGRLEGQVKEWRR